MWTSYNKKTKPGATEDASLPFPRVAGVGGALGAALWGGAVLELLPE